MNGLVLVGGRPLVNDVLLIMRGSGQWSKPNPRGLIISSTTKYDVCKKAGNGLGVWRMEEESRWG